MGSRVPANLLSSPVFPADHPTAVDEPADVDDQVDDQVGEISSEKSVDEEGLDIRKRQGAVTAAASAG
jgi:hypothetical protein